MKRGSCMPSKTKMTPLRMKPSVSQTPLACMRWRASLGRVTMGEKRHDHARHDHGDDGADVNLVADEVDHEGQEQLEGHVQVGAVDAATADELQQQPCREAQDDTPDKATEELQGELLAGHAPGKVPP